MLSVIGVVNYLFSWEILSYTLEKQTKDKILLPYTNRTTDKISKKQTQETTQHMDSIQEHV